MWVLCRSEKSIKTYSTGASSWKIHWTGLEALNLFGRVFHKNTSINWRFDFTDNNYKDNNSNNGNNDNNDGEWNEIVTRKPKSLTNILK